MHDVKKWFTHSLKLFVPVFILSVLNCLMVLATWFELLITGTIQRMVTPLLVFGAFNVIFGFLFVASISTMIVKFLKISK